MKKERKEALLNCFPPVPENLMDAMIGQKKRGAENFVIFLTRGSELFARCFHRYYNGNLAERQRFVFAKDGCCRYGSEDGKSWTIRTEFREPVFCAASGYNFDNSYTVLNIGAVRKSDMRYSLADEYGGNLLMSYLALYVKHPNIEYLMKSGYSSVIVEDVVGYWNYSPSKIRVDDSIDLRSNNLLKMLGLNRTEFKTLRGSEKLYFEYITWRKAYPKLKPEELLTVARAFGCELGTAEKLTGLTKVRLPRLAAYLLENEVRPRDYEDYLGQCRKLRYDLHDTAICMPRDFETMHERLSQIIRCETDAITKRFFEENYGERKKLEFCSGKYMIRQPRTLDEITEEGKALHHCVGGYAQRHAKGKLTILFIRRTDNPESPFYTMELSADGRIMQVRGMRNRDPSNSVAAFVKEYRGYIESIFKKARKTA